MKYIIIILISALTLKAQDHLLNKYIEEGLKNNLALRQKNIAVDKAIVSLKEARSYFFPSVNFQSDYNLADGGRKIDFPAGDMMNPVYMTLNQLTQSKNFPQIQNQSIQLLPDNYHDTRVEIEMPIFNTDIWYNNQIKEEAITMKQAESDTYKKELIKEIKTAYYNYIKTIRAISIYRNAEALLNDSYKLTETLVKNDMALKSNLLKLSSEIGKNEALLKEAENNSKNASAYLNFLLNRPLDIQVPADTTFLPLNKNTRENASYSISGREELVQIKSGISQLKYYSSMNAGEYLPSLGAFLAAGYQGTKYKFDRDQRYYLFGLQFKWNLFNGMGTSSKKEQTDYELNSMNLKLDETEKQLSLQLSAAIKNLNTAEIKAESAKKNLEYSQEYYRQVRLRYSAGQALLLELTDALTQHINNQMLYQLCLTDILIKQAELERASGQTNF